MIPQYLNPLGFVDKPNETGATFILTNPKESKTLEPGTPVTIWRYSRGLLALDRIQGEITRVGYTTAVFTITGRETDPRWPEDQEILREKTPVYLGLKDSLSQADGTSVLDVERSYAYVVADLNLNFVKPARDMPIDGQRFVVELY